MNKSELHESILNKSQISFARSGGHGGQNVNKLNTKVHLVLAITDISGISEIERVNCTQFFGHFMLSYLYIELQLEFDNKEHLNLFHN